MTLSTMPRLLWLICDVIVCKGMEVASRTLTSLDAVNNAKVVMVDIDKSLMFVRCKLLEVFLHFTTRFLI